MKSYGRFSRGSTVFICQSFELPEGLERMAGEWMGMVINTGTLENPVKCEEHRDVKTAKYGISCLYSLGDFTGGNVILWKLKTAVALRPGDLLFLWDNLITHSNNDVKGVRHSIVAFTREDMCDWKKRLGEYREDREVPDKERQQMWRDEEVYKEDSRLPP